MAEQCEMHHSRSVGHARSMTGMNRSNNSVEPFTYASCALSRDANDWKVLKSW